MNPRQKAKGGCDKSQSVPGMLSVRLALVLMPVISMSVAVAETLSLGGFFPISTQPGVLAAANLAVQVINDKSDGI